MSGGYYTSKRSLPANKQINVIAGVLFSGICKGKISCEAHKPLFKFRANCFQADVFPAIAAKKILAPQPASLCNVPRFF